MGNDSTAKQLTGSATTTIGAAFLYAICVNKTLTGTLTVSDTGSTVATFAIGTLPGTYHVVPNGARYGSLACALSAGDDVTVYVRKAV